MSLDTKVNDLTDKRDDAQKTATKDMDDIKAKMAEPLRAVSEKIFLRWANRIPPPQNDITKQLFAGQEAIAKEQDQQRQLGVAKDAAKASLADNGTRSIWTATIKRSLRPPKCNNTSFHK